MMNPKVLILLGSESDFPTMSLALDVFQAFGVPANLQVASAHRSPARVAELLSEAERTGVRIIIAAAGMAAHLAGVVAGKTTLPVIGVPIDSPPLQGVDSLYSTVMMPPGVPVATVGIGKAGAKNAAHLAVQILALSDTSLSERMIAFRKAQASEVEEANRRVQAKLAERTP